MTWGDVRTNLQDRHISSTLYSGSSDITNGDENIIEYVLHAISLYVRSWSIGCSCLDRVIGIRPHNLFNATCMPGLRDILVDRDDNLLSLVETGKSFDNAK